MIDFLSRPPVLTPRAPRPRERTTTLIPYIRRAWLLDDDDLIELEVVGILYCLESETTRYLARIIGSVGVLSEFGAGSVCFSEGDALRVRTVRQDAARRARLHAERGRQVDEAIEDLLR